MIAIRFETGPLAGEVLELERETVIGRGDVDVVVEDPEISRRHLVVRPIAGGYEAEDLGSLNGTTLNGIPLAAPRPLAEDDRLELGGIEVTVDRITIAARPSASTSAVERPASLAAGTRLGQYEVRGVVGRGSTSTIYRAYQASLDRFVSIKVLVQTDDEQMVQRFRREAKAIAHLQHPNILPVYDHGEHDGILYLVTQYVDCGLTVADTLGEPMEPLRALGLIGQILEALDHAHGHGVVHRDIKPSNILLPLPSWPMLADFGIAKILEEQDQRQLTQHGLIIGTAAYMSPEQVLAKPVDGRSDLYSTGAVLFEMLTGRLPFEAESAVEIMAQHAYATVPPATSLVPELPRDVDAVLARAMAKDPDHRFATAADMAASIARLAETVGRATPGDQLTGTYQRGISAFTDGRWDDAIEELSRVIEADPEYEDAHHMLEAAKEARDAGAVTRPRGASGVGAPGAPSAGADGR
jgi:serine/threonine protein kinase